jgi:predicted aspartyl protease
MNIFQFELNKSNNVILVETIFDFSTLIFLLDTGASHSIIDLSSVIIEGYNANEFVEKVEVETANGVIQADIFKVKFLKSLGIERKDFKVMTYDFIGNGLFTSFDGVLGIDFLQNNKICIDFIKSEISIS